MEELHSRNSYKREVYAPYYVCSYAVHAFNLINQRQGIYWEGKKIPNMRLHILFVAPPGYMKTYYMGVMGADRFGVFTNGGITIGAEQSMTEAGFIGTIRSEAGLVTRTEGAAETFQNGLLLIDEFSAITNALKVSYNSQMDSQLLSALDHGKVYKRLGGGKIEYITNLTLWAGVQPARYDLTSGLGRRMCFLLFLPTRLDNDALMDAMHKARNIRADELEMTKIWDKIQVWHKNMEVIKSVEFDDSVFAMYKKLGLFSYESSYFDRLALGYQLATYGPEKKISITIKDKELQRMLMREKKWRDDIGKGVDYIQLRKTIEVCGVEGEDGGISITKSELVDECVMVGWNAQQVHEMLIEMQKFGIIRIKGSLVILGGG